MTPLTVLKGHNVLHGNDGGDTIYSDKSTSELFGDNGDGTLNAYLGKGGDHSLTGGEGDDSFNLYAASDTLQSATEINGFVIGQDELMIDGVTIYSSDLPEGLELSENDDGNLVVSFNDDDTVTLTNVSIGNFTGAGAGAGIMFLGDTGLPVIRPDPEAFEAVVADDAMDDLVIG